MEYETIGSFKLQPIILESEELDLKLGLEELLFFDLHHPKITRLLIEELNEDEAIKRYLNDRLNHLSRSKVHQPDSQKQRDKPLYFLKSHNSVNLSLDELTPLQECSGTKFLEWFERFKKNPLRYLKDKKLKVMIFSHYMGVGAYDVHSPIIQANYGFYPLKDNIRSPTCRNGTDKDYHVSQIDLVHGEADFI